MTRALTNDDIDVIDAYLLRVLTALGSMEEDTRTGRWYMKPDVRKQISYEGWWEIRTFFHDPPDNIDIERLRAFVKAGG